MTSINDIRDEINKLLAEYAENVGEEVSEIAEKIAKETAKKLKATSPVQNVSGGGDYAKGWRAKKVGTTWIVHNATNYQLTHLLENGHVSRNGTQRRFTPDVKAHVHLKPVEQAAINEFMREIERAINNQ